MSHLVGSTVLVQLTVRDAITGDLSNATVDLIIRDPDGNETVEVPTNPSTGIYEHFLTLDEPGLWYAIWTATVGDYSEVTECCVAARDSILAGSST